MRRLAATALAGIAIGALGAASGCGDDEETTVTEQRTVTETTAQSTQPATAETEPSSEPRSQGPRHFRTPSGNIGCYLDAGGARCDISRRSWNPPPAPASCELDYGQGLTLGRDGAGFVCAGDTTLGAPAILPYGAAAQRGSFRCESEEAGVTCTDVGGAAGFFISRQSYRIL